MRQENKLQCTSQYETPSSPAPSTRLGIRGDFNFMPDYVRVDYSRKHPPGASDIVIVLQLPDIYKQ